MTFRDRVDAGKRLGERCLGYRDRSPLVLGMPRGGVPVAAQVADALDAPLDVLVARKLGAPFQPELGLGAIAPDGVRVLNRRLIDMLGVAPEAIEEVAAREALELSRRLALYRGNRPPLTVAGRTVLLVDDGVATGYTVRAGIRWLRSRPGLAGLVLAVPVIAAATAREIRPEVDDLVALATPDDLQAIGAWYEDFSQTSDEEVTGLLAVAASRSPAPAASRVEREVAIPLPAGARLVGDLVVPAGARGIVVFAHGSGSGRKSPRNRRVAETIQQAGLATLLLDLLTREEERVDAVTGHLRFDVRLLADRLLAAVDLLAKDPQTARLPVGAFGSSTGGGAALVAAARRPEAIAAVVSRGGRPDLAGADLARVTAPTLLLVGGRDEPVIAMNREAMRAMKCEVRLEIVTGATHLFEEPGTLDDVASRAARWFSERLAAKGPPAPA